MEKKTAQLLNLPFLKEISEEDKPLENILKDVMEEHSSPQHSSPQDRYLGEVDGEPSKENENGEEGKEVGEDGEKTEHVFKLSLVPGADSQEDILEVEEAPHTEETQKAIDEWDWESMGVSKFLDWLKGRFDNIPRHSGQDTTGIERAFAYFKKLNGEISRAMSMDYKREIDAAQAEQARAEIMKGMERLTERLKKLRTQKFKLSDKKAEEAEQLIKTAETSTVGRMVVTIPYLVSNIARTCIESTVQGGRDIEDVFVKLAEEYKLDRREKSQVVQLIKDMGYPMLLDRVNPFEDIKPSQTEEVSEYAAQYYA